MDKDYIKEEKSMDLSALRERLIAENEQKIWDEAREKFTPRKLQDVPLEELKEWYDKMYDAFRDEHPELSYSEWYLMCMRNEIYIRQQLGYTDDTTTWDVRNDILQEIKKREEYKKWHPYEPLTREDISEVLRTEKRIPGIRAEWAFLDKAIEELSSVEYIISDGTEEMSWIKVSKATRELRQAIRDILHSNADDYLYKDLARLKLYREYLIKYRLKDVLSEGLSLREATHDLVRQLEEIKESKCHNDEDEDFDFDEGEGLEDMDDEELKPLLDELDDEELKKLEED